MRGSSIHNFYRFLTEHFPQSRVKFISSGWSSDVFLVDDNVLKFPRHNISDYEHEMMICRRLKANMSFDIPEITIAYDADYPYAQYKRIDGHKLSDLHGKNKMGLADDCALFLSQVHSCQTITGIGKIQDSAPLCVAQLREGINPFFSDQQLCDLCEIYEAAVSRVAEENVLIHADFHKDNFVVDDTGRLKGIFDWCNSGLGERERDFIYLYTDIDEVSFKRILITYERIGGICIDTERVREVALIKLLNGLYWSGGDPETVLSILRRLERV